ncbi:potassium channel family protein [Solemya velesiana gill symbiont]|uniref:potassium channel family protein n=1 Tax=Solemya velesiana gill symbiont TaxID=1918948 RepID=UPI001FE2FD5B|nr:NAD-binding protein [Solemya velesiana gill symbiont]
MRENRVYAELEKRKGKHTIICGFGRIGQVVAERLAAERENIVIIDADLEQVNEARKLGYLVIEGSAERSDLLENAGIGDRAERILCLTDDDVANVYITLTAKYMNPEIEVISRANREESVRKLYQAGADHTVSTSQVFGLIAGEYIGQPVAFEAIHGILSGKDGIALETVVVRPGSALEGKRIGEIDFYGKRLVLFGVITHTDRLPGEPTSAYSLLSRQLHFNPGSDFCLNGNDTLVVFGHQFSIVHFKGRLESDSL